MASLKNRNNYDTPYEVLSNTVKESFLTGYNGLVLINTKLEGAIETHHKLAPLELEKEFLTLGVEVARKRERLADLGYEVVDGEVKKLLTTPTEDINIL